MKPRPIAIRQPAWLLVALLLASYVVAEAAFNLRLVETVAAAKVDPDEIDALTTLGKLTGSFGLVLFALRPFAGRLWRRAGRGLPVVFLVVWAGTYAALTHVYDAVLDRVPVATQYEAFYLMLYREAVFDGFVKNADLRAGDGNLDDSHRLALVNLAARLTGEKPEIAAIRDWIAQGEMARMEGVALEPRALEALARARDVGDGTLRRATAAIFLPPMSMTLSLLAIVANLGALAALLLSRLRRLPSGWLGAALPLVAVAAFLAVASEPPFAAESGNFRLYTQLESRLGTLGWIWGRAINGEAAILRLSHAQADGAPPQEA